MLLLINVVLANWYYRKHRKTIRIAQQNCKEAIHNVQQDVYKLQKFHELQDTLTYQRLVNWSSNKKETPNYQVTTQEQRFIDQVSDIMKTQGNKIIYSIEAPLYFYEHAMSLYHILPGAFCGDIKSKQSINNAKILVERGFGIENIFLFHNTNYIYQYLKENESFMYVVVGDGYSWGGSDDIKASIIHLSHGIDNDSVFSGDVDVLSPDTCPEQDHSLVFTRYNESQITNCKDIIKSFYKIDPNKKTILYIGTVGKVEFIEEEAPPRVSEKTFSDLVALRKKYNVVVRPHPLLPNKSMEKLKSEFIIAPQDKFLSFMPFFDIADIVIATPSAGGSLAAASRPEIPLILLLPTVTWDGERNTEKLQKANSNLLLSNSNAIMQNEKSIDLVKAVEEAFHDPHKNERINKRKEYFKYWFNCIDGYEDYRTIMRNLEEYVKVDVSILKDLYKDFPEYKRRKLCKYVPRNQI